MNNHVASALEVESATSENRDDLSRRSEVKFTIPYASIDVVRDAIETRCRGISYNERVSYVRSVYFDDARLSCCRANINGLSKRTKVRMRWYDSRLPQNDIFFEMKWRENRVTGKRRTHIHTNRPIGSTPYDEFVAIIRDSLPEEQQPLLMRFNLPTVLVEYRRQHFHSPEGNVRLTLDYDIVGYDQMGQRSINTSFGRPIPGLVVVEGKTNVGEERLLRELVSLIKTRAGRCSKYVQCCQIFGYVYE